MFISLRQKRGKKKVILKNQSRGWKSFPVPSVRIGHFCSWKSNTRLARTVKASQRLLANFDLPELQKDLSATPWQEADKSVCREWPTFTVSVEA